MDEFIAELRLLKAWAGNPSITEITRRVHTAWHKAGRPRSEWPARSTVGNCFQVGRRRPNTDLLLAVVHALVEGDEASLSAWRQALRAVLGEAEAAAQVSAYDRLPDTRPPLIGRAGLLRQADALLGAGGAGRAVVLEGMAGAGKSALAFHIGHRLIAAGKIAGPVLFAQLRGCGVDGPAADPTAVLESFLRLLGVSGDRIPYGLDARAALYRQLLADTQALVMLDDVADEDQLRPLLPGTARTCRTVITTRQTLRGLDGLTKLPVPTLSPDESLELLRTVAGAQRLGSDAASAHRITDLLGHHPLALSIIGRHMREHPAWALADYYREPLTTLAMEGGARASLAASDMQLPTGARRLLRLLALHPPHELDVHAVAALADQPVATARRNLDTLAAAHLAERTGPGWYRLHDLVHAYAEERICIDEPASHIRQALRRVLAHYENRTAANSSAPLPARQPGRGARPRRFKHAEAWADVKLPSRPDGHQALAA
ncbi:NB-ARC domain-containing protein [Streptomyces violascens]|nr:NB-ARC domain-containing protein [Streptomyces violascens]